LLAVFLGAGCLVVGKIAGRPAGLAAPGQGFSVGGTVSGLGGGTLVLSDGVETVRVTQDGSFAFPAKLADGAAYAVTVTSAPNGVTCTVTGGTGAVASADVSSVAVSCSAEGTTPTVAAKDAPRLFFTDLLSGPNSGGSGNNGVFLTIYGLGFGAARGASTVTIGGVEVASYTSWGAPGPARGLETIVVQPGAAVASGSIVVTVGGRASNALPFTVRAGRIVTVTTAAELQAALADKRDGDTVYLRAGTYGATMPKCGATAIIGVDDADAPNPAAPIAFVGYPGEVAQLGDMASPPQFGVCINYAGNGSTTAGNFVFARLTFMYAIDITANVVGHPRFIGNTFTLTSITNRTGTIVAQDNATGMRIYGNRVTQVGNSLGSAGVIFFRLSTDGDAVSDIDIGWNEVDHFDNDAAVSATVFGAPDSLTGFVVHDNALHDSGRSMSAPHVGVSIEVDASTTAAPVTVDVYNNIFVHTTDSAITITSEPTNATYRIEHNTFYQDDNMGGGHELYLLTNKAPATCKGTIELKNNIFVPSDVGFAYVAYYNCAATDLTASGNYFFHGAMPATWPGGNGALRYSQSGMPFSDTSTFALAPGSQAIDAGDASTFVTSDYYGRARSQGGAPDVGAVEYYP
jgi:hypothetical protein